MAEGERGGGGGRPAGAEEGGEGDVRLDTGLAVKRAGLADEAMRLLLEQDQALVVGACHALHRLVVRSRSVADAPPAESPPRTRTLAGARMSRATSRDMRDVASHAGRGPGDGGPGVEQEGVWRRLLARLEGLRHSRWPADGALDRGEECGGPEATDGVGAGAEAGGGGGHSAWAETEDGDSRRDRDAAQPAAEQPVAERARASQAVEVYRVGLRDLEAAGEWLSESMRAAGRRQWAAVCGDAAQETRRLRGLLRQVEMRRSVARISVAYSTA
jgi:hypothetical protein